MAGGIDPHRSAETAAVTARHDVHRDAARDEVRGQRQRDRGLAGAAGDQIADAHHWNRRRDRAWRKRCRNRPAASQPAPTGSSSSDSSPGGRAQKAGAVRIRLAPDGGGGASSLDRRELVEPGREPLQDRIENTETGRRNAGSGGSALGSQPLIVEQRRYRLRERRSAAHGFGGARRCQRSRHRGAIAHIRAMQHGAAESGRLERVVPALGDQRAADEGDPGEAVEQPELAHCVREIDLRVASDRIAASAPGDAQPLLRQHGADCVAARRVAGSDDRQQAGMSRGKLAMYSRGDLLLAGVRAGSEPHWTRTDRVTQAQQFASGRTAMRERRL